MNRSARRAGVALARPAMRKAWEPFVLVPESDNPALFARQRARVGDLRSFWKNHLYSVQIYGRAFGTLEVLHLVVRRHDHAEIQGWDHLQRIKNELAGEDRVAIEIYPTESEVMDQANLRHLFVLPEGMSAPFTLHGRWS